MYLNNAPLIESLVHPSTRNSPSPRFPAVPPSPMLLRALPPTSHLVKLSKDSSRAAQHRQALEASLSSALETPLDAHPAPAPDKRHAPSQTAGLKSVQSRVGGKRGGGKFEPSDVLKAIDKKDIMTLMEIRNQQFQLLLLPIGGVVPLVSAMRRGKSHTEVQIVLTGAFSRRVNDITDHELALSSPETKGLLRSIRANLRIAISHGLATRDNSLLASFLQVIIMSDGDRWILDSTHKVALALRSGPGGKPVESAGKIVEKWMGRELKASEIASVGEYVANATGDLVLLGLWSIVTDKVLDGEPIPLYFFARDDRITK
ncbi:hypothetical protein BCR35DRAFT_300542 [Leucosporidium creatinivorum]|uniref:Uncharacterized protein n=1 Tax=Leucosporidium creatinivorum TaxID=106004 RepID=A0A1Y2G1I1_9BASI|nr:hypothetical protein BCR35DRAFT_300542 [Leucosporidium creatinivorum]